MSRFCLGHNMTQVQIECMFFRILVKNIISSCVTFVFMHSCIKLSSSLTGAACVLIVTSDPADNIGFFVPLWGLVVWAMLQSFQIHRWYIRAVLSCSLLLVYFSSFRLRLFLWSFLNIRFAKTPWCGNFLRLLICLNFIVMQCFCSREQCSPEKYPVNILVVDTAVCYLVRVRVCHTLSPWLMMKHFRANDRYQR